MLSYFCYLLLVQQREAGVKKTHLCAFKDKQIATSSLSKFKEQGYDTRVTFHIHILQRTACIHTVKLPYCHQQSYIQTVSRIQSLASGTQGVTGKGATSPELCCGCTTTCRMNGECVTAWAHAQCCFSLPMQTFLQSCRNICREGRREERAAEPPPSAEPSACASSCYSWNFSSALTTALNYAR